MKAALTPAYGPANVIGIVERPTPQVGDHDVLVQVHASMVTAGDRRVRAADFPSATALIGRLAIGITKPRHPVQGTMFAGRVVDVGAAVSRYSVGDNVFGSADHGAYAEYLSISEDSSMARLPEGKSYEQGAAVPYGAGTALNFLSELGSVKSGDKVLVLGGSGGVGRYAIQLAKHMGAEVTAVGSEDNLDLMRELGADHVIDYRAEDFTQNGQHYDVIFDIADATTFGRARGSLTADGRYMTLYLSFGVLMNVARTTVLGGQQAKFAIHLGTREQTEQLADLLREGVIRPVIAARFPLDEIAAAHAAADAGEASGDVVVTVVPPVTLRAAV